MTEERVPYIVAKQPQFFSFPDIIDTLGLSVYAFRVYMHMKRRYDEIGQDPDLTLREIAKHCNMSLGSVVKAQKELIERNVLVEVVGIPYQEAEALLRKKVGQQIDGLDNEGRRCEWCGGTTLALQLHHYPVNQLDGGTETVRICANCHYEFHRLVRKSLRINGDYV